MVKKKFLMVRAVSAGITLVALLFSSGMVLAQAPGMGAGNVNAAMVKLFGTNTGFSARAEFHVIDKRQKETDMMPANYAFLDGKTRMEIDLTQVKSADIPASALATLKQLSMDQTVVISRPDKKLTYSIYPRAKVYAEIPLTKEETAATDISFKVERASLVKTEATVWTATDLKGFPIQMQMAPDVDNMMLIKFKDLKLAKPDAKQFEPPAAMTSYDSAEKMREALMKAAAPAARN